jgi:glycosyltransferase involved in cell wall biosynthesis
MKIAIIHDDFSICGGGEKLIALLARGLANLGWETEIITFDIAEETKKIIPAGVKIKVIGEKGPKISNDLIRRYLFSKLDLKRSFDFFVFSGSASFCAAKNNEPNMLYCHSVPALAGSVMVKPQKELEMFRNSLIERVWTKLYRLKNGLITKEVPKFIANRIDALRLMVADAEWRWNWKFLIYQPSEKEAIRHVQKIVVNSCHIRNKVKRFYGRESRIIYPPVEISKYRCQNPENFWISINRIVPAKRIEMQLAAFSKLPEEKLYIVGHNEDSEYYNQLMQAKPPNVEFIGVVEEAELIDRLGKCKGLIFTARDEDFGMAPVEAMASGKPVIAPNEGGCQETIIDGETGILINEIDADKIIGAVKKMSQRLALDPEKYKKACLKQAGNFSFDNFIEKMSEEVKKGAKSV